MSKENLAGATFVLILTLFSATLLFADSWATKIFVAVFLIAFLISIRKIWYPTGDSLLRVRLAAIGLVGTVVASATYYLWKDSGFLVFFYTYIESLPFFDDLIKSPSIENSGGSFEPLSSSLDPLAALIAILTFVIAALFIILRLPQNVSALNPHNLSLEEELPEPGITDKIAAFKEHLEQDLIKIDFASHWETRLFEPLHAEIEVEGIKSRKRQVVSDLIQAIRYERKAEVFLVLGDPGSGKSVSMRLLAKRLLNEIPTSNKIPVYINLKEWHETKSWKNDYEPTPKDLADFVQRYMQSRCAVLAANFLSNYFDRLLSNGRFFFIFDSFDEIPALLDADENSALVAKLSNVFSLFSRSSINQQCLVASRFYRRPKIIARQICTFEIRPFSNIQIRNYLKRTQFFSPSLIRELLATRQDLVALVRNPFLCALLADYVIRTQSLPENQSSLFQGYIVSRIASATKKLEELHLNSAQLESYAARIAYTMFEQDDLGLEASLDELATAGPRKDVEKVLQFLAYIKIGRFNDSNELHSGSSRFSFIHRRFNEYFLVMKLLNEDATNKLQSIPQDSRWRDALVLYVELCNQKQKSAVAEYCWHIIKIADDQKNHIEANDLHTTKLDSFHALRFLRDAFITNAESLGTIRTQLATKLRTLISPTENVLSVKLACEAVSLVPQDQMPPLLLQALEIKNPWIIETAISSCRRLSNLNEDLTRKIAAYINWLSIDEFIKRYREICFSFELSDAFKGLYSLVQARFVGLILSLIAICILSIHLFYGVLIAAFFAVVATLCTSLPLHIMQANRYIFASAKDTREHPYTDNSFADKVNQKFRSFLLLMKPIDMGLFLFRAMTIITAFTWYIRPLGGAPISEGKEGILWGLLDELNAALVSEKDKISLTLAKFEVYNPVGLSSEQLQFLAILCIFFLVPLQLITHFRISVSPIIEQLRGLNLRLLGIMATTGVVSALTMSLILYALKQLGILHLLIYLLLAPFLLIIILMVLFYLIGFLTDNFRINKLPILQTMPRDKIEELFNSLMLESSRLKFTNILIEKKIKTTGSWSSSFINAQTCTGARLILARLDFKHSGFE
ncbi:MAG: NACHT domain-containing protein [Rhodospirillaceae bacterium]|nr:NACHT domain-containing protein [Rhodospirillaceae bacterium]